MYSDVEDHRRTEPFDLDALFAGAAQYSLDKVRNAAVNPDPFPFVYIENIFPPAVYAQMQRHLPADNQYQRLVDTGRVSTNYSPSRLFLTPHALKDVEQSEEARSFWTAFFANYNTAEFASGWFQLFQSTIFERLRNEPKWVTERGEYSAYHEMLLIRDLEMYDLGPHTDSPSKAVSVLFYLATHSSWPDLGTSLFVPKDPNFTCAGGPTHPGKLFRRHSILRYAPNTVFAFPRTNKSFHGVEIVEGTNRRRDVLLLDLQFYPAQQG